MNIPFSSPRMLVLLFAGAVALFSAEVSTSPHPVELNETIRQMAAGGDQRCLLAAALLSDVNVDLARKAKLGIDVRSKHANEMRQWYAKASALGEASFLGKGVDFMSFEADQMHKERLLAVKRYADSIAIVPCLEPLLYAVAMPEGAFAEADSSRNDIITKLAKKAYRASETNPWLKLQLAAFFQSELGKSWKPGELDLTQYVAVAITELEGIAGSLNPEVYLYLSDLFGKPLYPALFRKDVDRAKAYRVQFETSSVANK